MRTKATQYAYLLLLAMLPIEKACLHASLPRSVIINIHSRSGALTSGVFFKKNTHHVRVMMHEETTIDVLKEWLVKKWIGKQKLSSHEIDRITPEHLDLTYKSQPCGNETTIARLAESPSEVIHGTAWLNITLDLHEKYKVSFIWETPEVSNDASATHNPFSVWVKVSEGKKWTLDKAFQSALKKSQQEKPEAYEFLWPTHDKQHPIELSPSETLQMLSSRQGVFDFPPITVRLIPSQEEMGDQEAVQEVVEEAEQEAPIPEPLDIKSISDQQEKVITSPQGIKHNIKLSLATSLALATGSWAYLRQKGKKKDKKIHK